MLSDRVIVLSPDRALGRRLAFGVVAGGSPAEALAGLEELPAGTIDARIVVVHLVDDSNALAAALAPRLAEKASLLVLAPAPSLARAVALLKLPGVAAVLAVEQISPRIIGAAAARLTRSGFGLGRVVPYGVRVHRLEVADYEEKSRGIAAVGEFAEHVGVRRKYREAIEQALDELLMNALYAAPVDEDGRHVFAFMPVKERIAIKLDRHAVVEYAGDGDTFYLAVRDQYGSLRRDTVVGFLDKCLHAAEQIDRKAGGAGLGLYFIANGASGYWTTVSPGRATEAVCTFDLLAPRPQLSEIGVVVLAPPATRPAQRPARSGVGRAIVAGLVAAIAVLLGLIAALAYPRLAGPGRGALAITTSPPGARVEIDGKDRGAAPLTVPGLVAGQPLKVAAFLDGHEPAVELARPERGRTVPLDLTLRPLPATVVIRTRPDGADVTAGARQLGKTPLTLTSLAPSSVEPIRLAHPGYVDLRAEIAVPGPGAHAEPTFALELAPGFATVRVDGDPPGAEVLEDGVLLPGVRTPAAEVLVTDGEHRFTFRLAGRLPGTVVAAVPPGGRDVPVRAVLVPGGALRLETNVEGARFTVVGVAACTDRPAPFVCPLGAGRYRVRLAGLRPFAAEVLDVVFDGGDVVRRVDLGFVAAAAGFTLDLTGAPADTRRVALGEGPHTVVVRDAAGRTAPHRVAVTLGKTTIVPASP